MYASGTSELAQSVLKSATVIRGAFVSLRNSPATTPMVRTFPEIGARTSTFCPNVPCSASYCAIKWRS